MVKLVPSIGYSDITGESRREVIINTCLYCCTCLNLYVSEQPKLARCMDGGCIQMWGLDGDWSCYFKYFWKGIERINNSQNGCYGCSLYSLVCCCHIYASCIRCIACNSYSEEYINENTLISVSFNPKNRKSKRERLMETGIRIPYTRIK